MTPFSRVLIVLINYNRPANMSGVIGAWRAQSLPPATLVVVDNSPAERDMSEVYPSPIFSGADDVWRMRTNLGCPCRFAPAIALWEHDYVLFADDDLLPGSKALENVVAVADQLEGKFSTIGQLGRLFELQKPEPYNPRRSPTRGPHPVECDLTCRVHLFRSKFAHHAIELRNDLRETVPSHLLHVHDDLLLCLGIQRASEYPSYVIPATDDSDKLLIKTDKDDRKGLWRRPGHFQERSQMVRAAEAQGWRRVTKEQV